ncbi:MAG: glycoside hydrolase family 127 protein [Clostridia bacterium]|nr:glycoside hydrolase family 127 protein [Clostridia bacterium]
MKNISFRDVTIGDGFWKDRQKVNSESTIYNVRDRFAETGRFDAFRFEWKEGMEKKPHIFWDSDIAKWIESVAFIIEKEPRPDLEKQVDEVVDLMEKNQRPDGYFNIYFTVCEPDKRFSNRDWHELYCAGHLTEAAVAYYYATGKDKMLKIMCKYLDLIDRVFRVEDSAAFHTPGHEEIELALVKLYRCTGEEKWLTLAKYFIDRRGMQEEVPEDYWCSSRYFQSHLPCREQFTAEGHSVRACYLYAGMADIAFEYDDEALKKACSALFDDIYNKKMYLTGGIGQSAVGEAFTVPYDLPNSRAYTETCAAIALVYFASRMQKMKVDSRLGDVIERAIFNGILSGVSLDGSAFFYKNPLEFLHAERGRNVGVPNQQEPFPEAVRQRVFGCSCCPPNITRFIASIGDYICGEDENTVYIHQYISSAVKTSKGDITIKTDYPYGAEIDISTDGSFSGKLALRIPGFSKDYYVLTVNGAETSPVIENGYAYIDIDGASTVNLVLDTMPKAVYANPLVNEDAGRVAVTMGPLVYCAESVDNGENLRALKIGSLADCKCEKDEKLGTTDIVIKGKRLTQNSFDGGLYAYERNYEPCEIRLIPFYACINRGECDMTVWLPSE